MGGSTNGLLHLPAIAGELGLQLPVELFDELSRTTPQTCAVKPNGPRAIEAIDQAGGIPAVMKNIKSLLELEVVNVTGGTLGETLEDAAVKDSDIIIVSPEATWGSGDVVVAMTEEGGTVINRMRIREDSIVLEPFNPLFPPIFYKIGQIQIIGKVVRIISHP